MPIVKAVHRPIVMRNHPFHADAEASANVRYQLCSPVQSTLLLALIVKFTNLDSEARCIAGAIVIGVLAGLVERHVLDYLAVVHGEVPDIKPSFVPLTGRANLPLAQQARMSRRCPAGTARAVDSHECRAQRHMDVAPKFPVRNKILTDWNAAADCPH